MENLTEDQIKKIAQAEILSFMNKKQFDLSKIQSHEHNGQDCIKIPVSSIKDSVTLTGVAGGVINSAVIGSNQNIDKLSSADLPNAPSISVLPVHVIYGFGVGTASAFNGGTAPSGTLIAFDNNGIPSLSQLWLKTDNAWLRFNADDPLGPTIVEAFPVGAIYTSIDSTNPATTLGYGTWVAFGAGRVLAGYSAGDPDFGTVEATGGEKTHVLTVPEIPAHTHKTGYQDGRSVASSGSSVPWNSSSVTDTGSTGGGGAHNNLQPFIVVYFFKRTA